MACKKTVTPIAFSQRLEFLVTGKSWKWCRIIGVPPRSLTYPLKSYQNPIGKGSSSNRNFFQGRTGKLLGGIQVCVWIIVTSKAGGLWWVESFQNENSNHKNPPKATTNQIIESQPENPTKRKKDPPSNKQTQKKTNNNLVGFPSFSPIRYMSLTCPFQAQKKQNSQTFIHVLILPPPHFGPKSPNHQIRFFSFGVSLNVSEDSTWVYPCRPFLRCNRPLVCLKGFDLDRWIHETFWERYDVLTYYWPWFVWRRVAGNCNKMMFMFDVEIFIYIYT